MTVNRQVGYVQNPTASRGERVNLGTVNIPNVLCRVTVTWKMIFAQASNISTYTGLGVWGCAIQYAATGSQPPAWNGAPNDASILAYDNAEPVGLERIFWAPSTAGASIVATFANTASWRGQLRIPGNHDIFAVPVDITNAAGTFQFSAAWQAWYA